MRSSARSLTTRRSNVVKTATSTGPYDSVGDVITYDIVVTNIGNVTLTGVTVTDPGVGAVLGACTPAIPATLAPTASVTCVATHAVTLADLDAGSYVNTATVDSDQTLADTDDETVPTTKLPALNVVKTATSTGPYDSVGDVITYDIVVTNIGNVTLTGVTVTDPGVGAVLGACTPAIPATLAPTASVTCAATHAVTLADLDAGSYVNTATADSDQTLADTDDETVTATQTKALTIVKTATPSTYHAVGNIISYSYVVKNTGNVTLSGPFTVSDDKAADESCPATTSLAPGASITCTASYTISQTDLNAGSVTNIASASGGGATSPTDTETVTAVQNKSLTIVKTATPTTYNAVNQIINYSYLITNNGNVTLSGPFTVSDDKATDEDCPPSPTSLAPGESVTCTASYKITQANLDAGAVTNIAAGHGFWGTTPVNSDTDTETVTATQTPKLSLTKAVAETALDAKDVTLHYTLVATNDGNVTLSGVSITDAKLRHADLHARQPATLAPTEILRCTGTDATTQTDVDTGRVTNTAQASGTFGTTPVPAEPASASVPPVQEPVLSQTKMGVLDKTVVAPNDRADAGDVINYTITAKNTGNVTLTNVTVADPLLGTLACTPTQPATLLPGASIVCTGSYTLLQSDINAGERANTATADSNQTPPTETPNVVPVPQDPKLSQTKVGVLDKTVVAPNDRADAGDVINYTITAKNDGNVTLTNVTVVDPLLGTLSCTPTQPATLLPGASIVCTGSYTLLQSDINAGERANTATADSNQTPPTETPNVVPVPQDPKLSQTKVGVLDKTVVAPNDRADAGDVINYTITAKNTGNVTLTNVTVADPLLGTLSCTPTQPATLLPGASIVCTGSYTLLQSDINAGERANTATADSNQTPPTETPNVVPVQQDPKLTIVKTATPTTYSAVGNVISYSYLLTNNGNVTLSGTFTVTDDKATDEACPATPTSLAPGAVRHLHRELQDHAGRPRCRRGDQHRRRTRLLGHHPGQLGH